MLRALALALCLASGVADRLPSYNVTTPITISGLSSGGFMAVQFHVAFSSLVSGAGILAAGPYWCAKGSLDIATSECQYVPGGINVQSLVEYTTKVQSENLIDDTANLKDDRVWILSGTEDEVVFTGVVEKLVTYYENYLTDSSTQLLSVFDIPSEHAFLTNGYGSKCSYLGSPYINDCSYDAAGNLLQHIFNNELALPESTDDDAGLDLGDIVTFDQTEYIDSGMGFYDTGYLYVPTQCSNSTAHCKLHVAFHGCEQTIADIDTQYVKYTGYNRWAAANDMIVLYPQAARVYTDDKNPKGCFDWWGYADKDTYAVQTGPQMAAVYNMIQDMM